MAKSNLVLAEGEELKGVLEGEMYATSLNPLVNFFLTIWGFLCRLVGVKRSSQVTVTNRRIVIEEKRTVFFCCPNSAGFRTILPQGVASVTYRFQATFLCCFLRKYTLELLETSGQTTGYYIKGGQKAASDMANMMVQAIIRN